MEPRSYGDVVYIGYPCGLRDAVRKIAEERGAAFFPITEFQETVAISDRKIDLVIVDIRTSHSILQPIQRYYIESDTPKDLSGIFLGDQDYELGMRTAFSSFMADFIKVPSVEEPISARLTEELKRKICQVWDNPECRNLAQKSRGKADRYRDIEFIGRFKHLIESSGLPVIATNTEGLIWEANFASHVLLEYGSEELHGLCIEDLVVYNQSPEEREHMTYSIERGPGWRGEIEFRMKHGGRLPCLADIARIWNDRSECIGKVYCLVDLRREKKIEHEKREMERQLYHSQKMEAIGQLAGGVAHDFNNLLTGIIGYLTLVMEDLEPSNPNHKRLQQVEKAALRAAELTRQLLAFGRRSLGNPEMIDLRQCINETLNLFRASAGARIEIAFHAPESIWPVKADPALMSQILMNLFVNARDAIPQEGRIDVILDNVQVSADEIPRDSEGIPGEYVRLEVRDTGPGMDEQIRERIFEPFFTTKGKESTGLGLPMVYGIVTQYKGWTSVESHPGQGTSIRIFLPRTRETSAMASLPVMKTAERGQGRVLIVDDEEVVLELAASIFKRHGYQVAKAVNGLEALSIFGKDSSIDLVLLDLTMPKMSGEKTLEEMLKMRPGARIILSSGYSLDGVGRDFRKEGAAAFIQKPYKPDDLIRCVQSVLDGKEYLSPVTAS